jgi:hypothetical protein
VKVSKEGYEAQLTDEADRTLVLSVSGRRLTNGDTLEITPVRFQMSEKEIMEWASNLVRVDEVSRAYQREKDWQPRS